LTGQDDKNDLNRGKTLLMLEKLEMMLRLSREEKISAQKERKEWNRSSGKKRG